MVPQLHVHIIARFKNDKAWPGAIWGTIPSVDNEILIKWKMLVCRHFKTT
jgi:diadenosine tetraphosphate (Ap4A) HIT family hydrolase